MNYDIPTPEIDRMIVTSEAGASQQIGEFLEWVFEEGYSLSRWNDSTMEYETWFPSIEMILSLYFNVDQRKVERERQALLASLRLQRNMEWRPGQ